MKLTEKIVGQEEVINKLNKLIEIFRNSIGEIRPHFILTGESGNSKTYIVKELAKYYNTAFLEVNAAQITKEGTSGNSLSKVLQPMMNYKNTLTIVFVDEFDKLFLSDNSNSSAINATTVGVQNEFLKLLEADTAEVYHDYGKYQSVDMSKTLFVFAGAFNNAENVTKDKLRNFGVKTEFLGRVPLVFNTNKLTLEDYFVILDKSELLKNYLQLFPNVDETKVKKVIKKHLEENYDKNTIGARLISSLITEYFINGGSIDKERTKKIAFQTTMELT